MWAGVAGVDWGPALVALRLARGVDLAASIALFGTLLFWVVIAQPLSPPGKSDVLRAGIARLVRITIAVKIVAALAWLPLQAAEMGTGRVDASRSFADLVAIVAFDTSFGRALALRTALAVAAAFVAGGLGSRRRVAAGTLIAGLALCLQAHLGHAAATEGLLLPASVALHVVAAGAWLGGLLPLALTLAAWPDVAAHTARRFSWLGLAAVILLTGTAAVQSVELVGHVGGWFGTAYGIVAQWKIAGLALLLAFAALNRFVLTPSVAGAGTGPRPLIISVATETFVGLAVVALGVWLATLPPGAHIQPVWPFAFQPDYTDIAAPHVRREIWRALLLLGVAAAGVASLFWRPLRIVGPIAAILTFAWLPTPNWRLLARPATETSFYRSETRFTAASIARGEELLRRHCTAACFRPVDDPSDLTPYNLWARTDGDLFGWLTRVFDVIGHSPFEHGAIARLSERERWLLIDYFRARVAGSAVNGSERWRYPIPAPALGLTCADGRKRQLRDLSGRIVQIVASGDGRLPRLPEPPPDIGVATVVLSKREPAIGELAGDICYTSSPDSWTAFAIVSDVDESALAGTRIHIDANGWLRTRVLPSDVLDDDTWRLEIADIASAPLVADVSGGHGH
ncbi:CopD family protein [Pseudochelatococcus lubricantis]|uniref:CopD family protein n=1 Tax=Pseudochelatococcus lubricantis TaxID=1538102 RepID=UPI0035F073E0